MVYPSKTFEIVDKIIKKGLFDELSNNLPYANSHWVYRFNNDFLLSLRFDLYKIYLSYNNQPCCTDMLIKYLIENDCQNIAKIIIFNLDLFD